MQLSFRTKRLIAGCVLVTLAFVHTDIYFETGVLGEAAGPLMYLLYVMLFLIVYYWVDQAAADRERDSR